VKFASRIFIGILSATSWRIVPGLKSLVDNVTCGIDIIVNLKDGF